MPILLVALVCLALTGYFAAVNTASVPVNFAGQSYPVSLALLTIKWTLVGAVAALCIVRLRRREEKNRAETAGMESPRRQAGSGNTLRRSEAAGSKSSDIGSGIE